MKRKLLLHALFMILASSGFAQKTKAPAAAIAAFEKAFPGAFAAKWGKEKDDYEVNFSLAYKKMAAVYTNGGTLKETEEDISVYALPALVTAYVKQHYENASIKEAAKIVKPGGEITYEAAVNHKDLIFDAKGKFIREEKDED